jgi:hypothetical protein
VLAASARPVGAAHRDPAAAEELQLEAVEADIVARQMVYSWRHMEVEPVDTGCMPVVRVVVREVLDEVVEVLRRPVG